MFCHNCGKAVPEGVKFCPYCGTRQMEMPAEETVQPAPQTNAWQPVQPPRRETWQTGTPNTAENPNTSAPKKKTGLILGLIGILVIAALLVILLKSCDGKKESAAAATEAATESTRAAGETEPEETEPEETEPPREETAWYSFEAEETTYDGYTIRHVLNISQWISYTNDFDTLEKAWAKVGKDRQLPSPGTMGVSSGSINNGQYTSFIQYDEIFYAVGTLEAFNETPDYDITESDPYTTYFSIGIGSVHSSLLVMYSNTTELFGVDNGGKRFETGAGYGISAKMKSNHWGTVPIVICYLIDKTPNEPQGFPTPDNLLVWFHNKNNCSFNLSGEPETEEPEQTEPETEAPETRAETTTKESGQIGTTEGIPGAELIGTYKGTYSPTQGKTGCTVTIYEEDGVLRGTFEFYNLKGKSNSREGSYAFTVQDLGGGIYCLKEDKWIDRPGNYNMISWYVTLNGDSLNGNSKQNGSGYPIETTRE